MANAKRKTILCAYMEDKINFREEMCTLISGIKVDGWLYKYAFENYNVWYIIDEKTGMAFANSNKRKDVVALFTDEQYQNNTYEFMQTESYKLTVEKIHNRKDELGFWN